MTWILFLITLTVDGPQYEILGEYNTLESCFQKRENVIEEIGRPIINYQSVCIAKDFD